MIDARLSDQYACIILIHSFSSQQPIDYITLSIYLFVTNITAELSLSIVECCHLPRLTPYLTLINPIDIYFVNPNKPFQCSEWSSAFCFILC